MKRGYFVFAAAGLLSALSGRSEIPSLPVLVADKDTVAGIESRSWISKGTWLGANTIRIRNTSALTVVIDSLRIPSDSIRARGYATPLQMAFAARSHGDISQTREFVDGFHQNGPITIPAGDSVDLGQFEIGRILVLVKASAATPAHRYDEDDSIVAPLTFFAGTNSIRFILKAKVTEFYYGTGGIAVRIGRRPATENTHTVTVNGRSAPEKQPVAHILIAY
jgi:hypothetical protein